MVNMATFWATPKTLISDGEGFATLDNERFWNLRIDDICMAMQHIGLRDKRGFCKRLTDKVMKTPSGHDVANLSDLEGIPEAEAEIVPKSLFGKTLSEPGNKRRTTWKKDFSIKQWPEVAYFLTRLTSEDIRKIRGMDFVQLKDLVQKEWPSRVEKIFTPGCDGMMKKTLQDRVINMLRLDLDELVSLTKDPRDSDHKERIMDYIHQVRPDLYRRLSVD